jgi:hypothetical protein
VPPKCPNCGSHNVRFAYMRTSRERLTSLIGRRPLRCRDCKTRFEYRIWTLSEITQARCPKCLGHDLTSWSPSQYHVNFCKGLMLFFGAHPYRCDRCRHNFVSFRRRKRRSCSRRRREPRTANSFPQDGGRPPEGAQLG